MKTYGRDQVLEYLAEIDEILAEPAAMEIIGGAAALLAYGAWSATKDIGGHAANVSQVGGRSTRTLVGVAITKHPAQVARSGPDSQAVT